MLFPTTDFAIFFAAVFLGHWLLNPHPVRWKVFMIAASYFFYGWWTISYVWLLAAASTIAQLGALQLWLKSLEEGEKAAIDAYFKGLSLGGSRPLPELFRATGLKFDFGPETVKRLVERAERELEKLPE